MRRIVVVALATLTLGCNNINQHHTLFAEFADKETVAIYLSNYNLDSVPRDIGALKAVKKLYISRDSMADGWTIYPPESAIQLWAEKPPFRHLPIEITRLKKLRTLELVHLDLVELPDNFNELENLDTLNLTMNKLTISNELNALKDLRSLKYLELFGNKVNAADIDALKIANPGLVIISDLEP